MTVLAWLAEHRDIERLDAELLVADVLGTDRARVIAFPEHVMAPAQVQALDALGERLRDSEPLAYLLQRKEFFGLSLRVDNRVLVPRPETELLVELTLARIATDAEVLELGTGCGAIAIALQKSCPGLQITAVDVAPEALAVARENADRHNVNVTFLTGDWFSTVAGTFDAIVSNPPYVCSNDPHLKALRHEPQRALIAGVDGLAAIGAIANDAGSFLKPEGLLIVEHGHDQGRRVRELFDKNRFQAIETHKDLAGLERVTTANRA